MNSPSIPARSGTRSSGRWTRRFCGFAACAALTACTAADNLTYGEISTELDGIVQIQGSGANRQVHYADRAPISAWYMRSPLTWPLRWPLGKLFGVRHENDLENPSGHVRELIAELPDEAGSDLETCADAAVRLALLAELDVGTGTQIVALDGLCRICEQLDVPLFVGALERVGASADPTLVAAARTAVQLGRPERRETQSWNVERAANYKQALDTLVDLPLPTWSDRLSLIGDLVELRRHETDDDLLGSTEHALRVAIANCVQSLLVRHVQGRDPQYADVRLCAMQQIRRMGGPRTVALLLAIMAAPASEVRSGMERFDPETTVRLRLIHLCGQLHGEIALQAIRLPNRADWEPIAPVDFLAQTILTEQDYFSKLRIPAMTALSLCLGRERLTYDLDWVRAWWKKRQGQA